MAIQRKPKTSSAMDDFVAGAPDAGVSRSTEVYEKGIAKGRKRQISLTIDPELLRKVDELASRTGQGRAGLINLAIYRAIEGDIFR